MNQTFAPSRKPAALAAALLLLSPWLAAPAQADPVSLVGGFRDYEGPVQSPDGFFDSSQSTFVTPVFSQQPAPTAPIPGCTGCADHHIGLATVGFYGGPIPMPDQVEFYKDGTTDPQVHNAISFTPATGLDVQVGDRFKLGSFTFTNGAWYGDLPDGTFEFQLHTVSADPALDSHYMDIHIGFHVTSGLSADGSYYSVLPVDNADYFYIAEYPELGYVGVYEADPALQPPGGSNTGSIDLWGQIGSLFPTGFENPQGVTLQAAIPIPGAAAIPEPATGALWLAGLALVVQVRRRARRGTPRVAGRTAAGA